MEKDETIKFEYCQNTNPEDLNLMKTLLCKNCGELHLDHTNQKQNLEFTIVNDVLMKESLKYIELKGHEDDIYCIR